jgi:hypothetical protein
MSTLPPTERQRSLHRARRRGATRGIAVEAEHDAIREPRESSQVLGRHRGAERRDDILDAELHEARDVEVALDDDDLFRSARVLPPSWRP